MHQFLLFLEKVAVGWPWDLKGMARNTAVTFYDPVTNYIPLAKLKYRVFKINSLNK